MKIMVTLDGTDFAEEVVEPAAKLARAANVEYTDQSLERITSDARDYLRQVGHRFAPVPVKVVAAVSEHAAEELASIAREHEVDLIAMASHGHTGLARLVMGNHVERVIRSGVAPVMVVRPASLHHH